MRPRLSQGIIRPKVSTMPRQQTEAAAYLEIYKLVNERTRLQQELQTLEERRDRIQTRLEALNIQVGDLEQTAHQLRDTPATEVKPAAPSVKLAAPMQTTPSKEFDTVFLEY